MRFANVGRLTDQCVAVTARCILNWEGAAGQPTQARSPGTFQIGPVSQNLFPIAFSRNGPSDMGKWDWREVLNDWSRGAPPDQPNGERWGASRLPARDGKDPYSVVRGAIAAAQLQTFIHPSSARRRYSRRMARSGTFRPFRRGMSNGSACQKPSFGPHPTGIAEQQKLVRFWNKGFCRARPDFHNWPMRHRKPSSRARQ